MDVLAYLGTKDEDERLFMLAIARAAAERQELLDHNRAVMIAEQVQNIFKK